MPGVRRAGPAGARGDRRLVRLGLGAVRPVRRAMAGAGRVRGLVPGPVHLRGAGPDQGLVLLADGRGDDGVRAFGVRERGVPGAARGRDRPQDEQAPGQRARADPADGRARRGRAALVLRGLRLAVGGAAGGPRRARRDRQEGPAHLLEHGVVPGPVRQRGRLDTVPTPRPGGASAAGPVDAERTARRGPGCHRRRWRPSTRRRPGGGSRGSSTTCPTGTCAGRGGGSGTGPRRPTGRRRSPRCTSA